MFKYELLLYTYLKRNEINLFIKAKDLIISLPTVSFQFLKITKSLVQLFKEWKLKMTSGEDVLNLVLIQRHSLNTCQSEND